MPEITIRPLAAGDRAAWEPLWRAYLAFYETVLPAETYNETFARLTGGAEPMGGFIAERDGQALGIVHWIRHRSCWNAQDVCYLQDLFTAETARGTGVGRRLIAAVGERAKADGCFRVYWLTHESNAQARVLYDKVAENSGFIVYRQAMG